jgi:hypothetical protein
MSSNSALEWMMWQVEKGQLDDPPEIHLIHAIQHFNEKYGGVPNRCELSPDWGESLKPPAGMEITRSKSVRPGHLMLALDTSMYTGFPVKKQKK